MKKIRHLPIASIYNARSVNVSIKINKYARDEEVHYACYHKETFQETEVIISVCRRFLLPERGVGTLLCQMLELGLTPEVVNKVTHCKYIMEGFT